jgi:hypothetical protein
MSDNSSADKLQQLFDLYKTGTITTEEFELLKSKLIGPENVEPQPKKETEPEIKSKEVPEPMPPISKKKDELSAEKPVVKPLELKNPAIEKRKADRLKTAAAKKAAVIPSIIAVGLLVVVIFVLLLSGVFNSSKKTGQATTNEKSITGVPLQVTSVTASSIMKPYKTYNYIPENVTDDNLQTWWSPTNPEINGEPSWVKIDFGSPRKISAVEIHNGSHFPDYPKYGNLYTMNNRVTEARLEFSDGTNQVISLREVDEIQRIEISQKETSYIRLIPTHWAEGTWKDICISNFKAIGE